MRSVPSTLGRAGSVLRAALAGLGLALWLAEGAGLGAGLAPGRGGDGLDGLRAKLSSGDKWTRAEAVEELAQVGSRAAWELVLEALSDPKGEVADTAQLALAALEEPEALEALGEEPGLRSKDVLVRARAVEVLGRRAAAPPRKWLARALDDGEGEVRRMAYWSIERLARGAKLDPRLVGELAAELARAARAERDPLARARALAALCALAPGEAAGALEAARRERDPLLRGAAAALLSEGLPPEQALAQLAPLAADSAVSVRRVALEALAALGTRAAAERLVVRLGEEGEERLLLRTVELLQGLSGLKHRRDPRPWNDWLRTLPPDWKAGPARAAPAEADPAARTAVGLAGLPIVSKRVTILIDLSGSIWNLRPDGRTRKQIVDEKLREALEALPEDTRFNLIPYTGEPHPWKEELVQASPARVREAASWFEACKHNGSGNLWDALLLALEDPEVDTLIVLFDGAPTGGTRHRLELFVPLFLERNFARRVALDFVLVDASKKLRRAWGDLAAATGGRLLAVTF